MGVGHDYCPLRRSIPQPRDVNAIEQLRKAREALWRWSASSLVGAVLTFLISGNF